MYNYGVIGNCQTSALTSNSGSIDWLCLPRPDSPPIFGRILDPHGGHFSVSPVGGYHTEQNYVSNTNVLVTTFFCDDGSEFQITDFCPRFEQHGRIYRPISLFRIVEPIKGSPQIKVTCVPVNGWEKEIVKPIRGNSHIKFEIRGDALRLVTNMSLTYLIEETPFALNEKIYFGLTWSLGIEDDLADVAKQFLIKTIDYWRTWVKHCSIPTRYQKETIRSALALKLHCYEDTGAILAALTTSLPEEISHDRNWDYRFCWLRDSAFVLSAFHNLGHFEEMEGFLKFLFNIGKKYEYSRRRLSPVYTLDQDLPTPEREHLNWIGFGNSTPVRSNNQAAEHIQNDVYGEMILTLAPVFFDERFQHLRTKENEEILYDLTELCIKNIGLPDAGLWEIRNGWQEHSFSNLMSWAGVDRILKIKEFGYLKKFDFDLLNISRNLVEHRILAAAKEGTVRNGPNDDSYDCALLLLPILRFPEKEVSRNTVLQIYDKLKFGFHDPENKFLFRYIRADDFGEPKSAFILCSFWLVQALAKIGEKNLASEIMEGAISSANNLGLLSEHYIPAKHQQCGNYPQAYSHVGLINAAFALSPPWADIL
jgi:GH15 family glucan-1,4-alpha-glucosidase